MKDNRELVNIFEECLERVLNGGETIEQCLAGYPEYAAELAPLLQTALEAKETLEITPRPEFREKARYQILTELRDIEERKQRRFSLFGWQPPSRDLPGRRSSNISRCGFSWLACQGRSGNSPRL